MKTIPQLLKPGRSGILACTLAATLLAIPAFADDTTNAASGPAATNTAGPTGVQIGKHGVSISVSGDSHLGLPKDVLDRMTPEQILELERMRRTGTQYEGVLVPLAFFGTAVCIVALVIAVRLKRNKMLHETIRAMIEKGVAIPPELLQPQEPKRRPRSDLRSGLAWLGIGIGVIVFFLIDGSKFWALGLIPLLIGVGFLVAWKVEPRKVE